MTFDYKLLLLHDTAPLEDGDLRKGDSAQEIPLPEEQPLGAEGYPVPPQ